MRVGGLGQLRWLASLERWGNGREKLHSLIPILTAGMVTKMVCEDGCREDCPRVFS